MHQSRNSALNHPTVRRVRALQSAAAIRDLLPAARKSGRWDMIAFNVRMMREAGLERSEISLRTGLTDLDWERVANE